MNTSANQLLATFDALPEMEKQKVFVELLRRMSEVTYQVPSDNDLLYEADQLFQEYDKREELG